MADEVSIPVTLLESMRETVSTAFYYSQTIDLSESYRKQQASPKFSPLTNKLNQTFELLTSFIELAKDEEETDGTDAQAD